MSFMFEVYYRPPPNPEREARVAASVAHHGGKLTYHESPAEGVDGPVVLTFEFSSREAAERSATELRAAGEHVEGPGDYGDT